MMTHVLVVTAIALCWGAAAPAAEGPRVKTTFQETDELLANPGMGWQTFHRFADQDKALAGLPSASAYFRFYWDEIEPKEGQIDFAKLDELLAHAHRAGQKLAFRVMCAGTDRKPMYVPQWLKDKGCKGFEYRYDGGERRYWVPDMEDPIFQEAHFRLIEELGKRYDGNPDLDLVDLGSVGLWGEWHMSGTGVEMPTPKTRRAIVDAYLKAFPKTPKVMLIGDEECMRYATHHGCGWRADCLGDMGGFSKTWSHMKNFYLQQVEKTDAGDAWKTAPVAFESCWDMRKWKEEGWDIHYIFDYALRLHCSYVNNKSAPIPDGTRPEVEQFLRKLGYRLVLKEIEHDASARAGRPLAVSLIWENAGVAPPYRDYNIAFRLTGPAETVLQSKTSVKGWLPGATKLTEELSLPAGLAPGRYKLAVGVVDPATGKPAVRLAIPGRTADGWYPATELTVTR